MSDSYSLINIIMLMSISMLKQILYLYYTIINGTRHMIECINPILQLPLFKHSLRVKCAHINFEPVMWNMHKDKQMINISLYICDLYYQYQYHCNFPFYKESIDFLYIILLYWYMRLYMIHDHWYITDLFYGSLKAMSFHLSSVIWLI